MATVGSLASVRTINSIDQYWDGGARPYAVTTPRTNCAGTGTTTTRLHPATLAAPSALSAA